MLCHHAAYLLAPDEPRVTTETCYVRGADRADGDRFWRSLTTPAWLESRAREDGVADHDDFGRERPKLERRPLPIRNRQIAFAEDVNRDAVHLHVARQPEMGRRERPDVGRLGEWRLGSLG